MITSTLAHLHRYKNIHPNLDAAIDYVLQTDLASLEDGTHEILQQDIFAIVKTYQTKRSADCNWERHRQYLDIQIMITGPERFGYMPLTDQQPLVPFQPDNDVAFFAVEGKESAFVTLQSGEFIIFFPEDIHQPDLMAEESAVVRKMVVKVKLG